MTTLRHLIAATVLGLAASAASAQTATTDQQPDVFFTSRITPAALTDVYHRLGLRAEGRVAVKISTGESGNPNYLSPVLIRDLVREVQGTIVECNTAYGGRRSTSEEHRRVAHEHGYDSLFTVDIMDEEGEMRIPVADSTHLHYNVVGTHLARYDFLVNLAHFKGHPMGGFGGVIKNQSIGVASAGGKAYIHTAGHQDKVEGMWQHVQDQDGFLESMAAAAQAVADYFKGRVVYIAVMNNMSVDCDCVSRPEPVRLKDMGVLASLDPVALDQACIDLVLGITPEDGNDNRPMRERISSRHGLHTLEHAEKIGFGSRHYRLIDIDKDSAEKK